MDTKNYIAASEYLNKFNESEIYQNAEVLLKIGNCTQNAIKAYSKIIDNSQKCKSKIYFPENIKLSLNI